MTKITVCMLAPEFYPVWGGVGTYIIELIKSLPENVDVHVIAPKRKLLPNTEAVVRAPKVNEVLKRPIQVHYLSTADDTFFYNVSFQYACLQHLPKLIKDEGIDVIHSHMSHMPDILYNMFKLNNTPIITTVHSTIKMQHEMSRFCPQFSQLEWSEKNTNFFFPAIHFLQKQYVKRVTKFIAVSNATKHVLTNNLKVPEGRISVVHNGIDTNLFHPPNKAELEKKFKEPTVLFSGRIIGGKGVGVLIEAIPKVLKKEPQTQFVFAGSGHIPFYRELAYSKGIPKKNIRFVGQLGYFDRLTFLRQTTLFVNPSYFENCSMSILEAMGSQMAVIASDVGS